MTVQDGTSMEQLAQLARKGDEHALQELVRRLQDRIYGLSVRMLDSVEDARDATQEILIKIVTNLARFRGDSAFTTWSYRITSNHLLNVKMKQREQFLEFDALGDLIDSGYAPPPAADQPERALLIKEMRLACTQSMLLCLDRSHRLAYILGEVLELDSSEAAEILDISPPAFRKRLSRARHKLESFMQARCGVYDAAQRCRCPSQISTAIHTGLIDPSRLQYSRHPVRADKPAPQARPLEAEIRETLNLMDSGKVMRTHPDYAAPGDFAGALKQLVNGYGIN